MSTFQQALTMYAGGEVDLKTLRSAVLAELALGPERYEHFRREVVQACQRLRLPVDVLEQLLDAIDEGKTRIATVVASVELESAPDATVFDGEATQFAADTALVRQRAQPRAGAPRPERTGATVGTVGESQLPTELKAHPVAGDGAKLKPGDVLNDQFELEEAIGEGGMGVIFRAKDTLDMQFSNTNPYVAVKVLSESFSDHRDSVMALHRETRNARSLRHDNIVRVDTFSRDARTGQYFMVMEYLRGEPLNRYMQRTGSRRRSLDEVWRICKGAGEGLQHAHTKGIIHSDIKPSNIWLTEDGNVKVLDFGIARVAKPDTQTVWEGLAALSVPYATQEMLRREEPDERDDVYALACVTYELLTGRHPFHKVDAIQAENEGLSVERPKGLKAQQWRTLKQALSLHREERTPSIAAFLEGMQPAKRPLPIYAGIAVLVGALLGTFVALSQGWFQLQSRPSEDEVYLAALLSTEPVKSLTKEEVADSLDMGHFVVDESRQDFERGDFQQGNQSLKNGATTAFREYYAVLEGSGDENQRQAAAIGILTLHKTYANTIARLSEVGMPKKALWLTCQSLAQPPGTRTPDWSRLVTQYELLWRQVQGEEPIPHAKGCNTTQVPDSWGDPLSTRSVGGWTRGLQAGGQR